jgi:hypothetical protein
LTHPDSFHPSALRLSRGTFYFAQTGTSHFAATQHRCNLIGLVVSCDTMAKSKKGASKRESSKLVVLGGFVGRWQSGWSCGRH